MDFQVEITCLAPHREREQGKLNLAETTRDLLVHCSDLSRIVAANLPSIFLIAAHLNLSSTYDPPQRRAIHRAP